KPLWRRTIIKLILQWYGLRNDTLLGVPYWLRRTARTLRDARAEVVRLDVKLLVLAEDNVGYDTAMWIRATHENGGSVLIVPYTIASASEAAEAYFNVRQNQVSE